MASDVSILGAPRHLYMEFKDGHFQLCCCEMTWTELGDDVRFVFGDAVIARQESGVVYSLD